MITASALDLLTFFETEPRALDDTPWPYNDYVYEVVQGGLRLSFAVAPAYQDVRIVLSLDGNTIFEWNAMGVADVSYRREPAGEVLEVQASERGRFEIRIKPRISIAGTHGK